MVGRNENGQFVKGYKGGPGRPPRAKEDKYYRILITACKASDWKAICEKAVDQAKRGDAVARKFIADYLIGAPVQKLEHTGKDGSELTIIVQYANDIRPPTDDSIT